MSTSIPFFDGHNDTVLRLFNPESGPRNGALFFEDTSEGHIDLPRANQAGMKGGFYALFVKSPAPGDITTQTFSADRPPEPTPDTATAMRECLTLAAGLYELERRGEGTFKVVRTHGELETAIRDDVHAAIFHIEGAEMIDEDLDALFVLYEAGLRSIGPVWSRSNHFAHGVPFRFPSSPDTGPGLSDAGFELVKACNDLGIMVDLSHMNEKGFWDVAKTSKAPLVATHSNVNALSQSSRNLTDAQLEAVRDSGGVVGLNYAVPFLREDGQHDGSTGLDVMIRHTDHMLNILGENGVALGSDFDGASIPDAIGDVRGVQNLFAAMLEHGYGRELVEKIALHNWVDVLGRTWK